MKPVKVKHLLERFAPVTRLYMVEEGPCVLRGCLDSPHPIPPRWQDRVVGCSVAASIPKRPHRPH